MSTPFQNIVYGYLDPRDGNLRYVGKSSVGMTRPNNIACHRHGYCGNWIKHLAIRGLKPCVVVLEALSSEASDADLNEAEIRQIALARANGSRLTNLTEGGDGGIVCDDFVNRVRSGRGPWTDGQKRKSSEAQKARLARMSPEERSAISRKGRDSAVATMTGRGYRHSPETLAKIATGQRRYQASLPQEVRRSRSPAIRVQQAGVR